VTINSSLEGEVGNSSVTFTAGAAVIPVTLTNVGGHELTVEVSGIPTVKTLFVEIAAKPEKEFFEKQLLPGWNIISIPLKLQTGKNTLGQIISDLEKVELAFMYDSEAAQKGDASEDLVVRWLQAGQETSFSPMDALFIKVTEQTTARMYPYEGFSGPYSRELFKGWNLLGPALNIDAEHSEMEARHVLNSLYDLQGGRCSYSQVISPPLGEQPYWVYAPTMEQSPFMKAGEGYWLYMLKDDCLAGSSITVPQEETVMELQEIAPLSTGEEPPSLPAAFYGTVRDQEGESIASGKIEVIIDGVVRAVRNFSDGQFGLSLGERLIVEKNYYAAMESIQYRVNGYAAEVVGNVDWSQASGELQELQLVVDMETPEVFAYESVAVRDSHTIELNFTRPLKSDLTSEELAELKGALLFSPSGGDYRPLEEGDTVTIDDKKLVIAFQQELQGSSNRLSLAGGVLQDTTGNLLTEAVETASFAVQPIDECFIATAAFGSKLNPAVALLRQFRDQCLLSNLPGQTFVKFYYANSPAVARTISENIFLKLIVRVMLIPFIIIAWAVLHYEATVFFLIGLAAVYVYQRRRQQNLPIR